MNQAADTPRGGTSTASLSAHASRLPWGLPVLVLVELALVLLLVHRFDIASRNHFFPVLCLAVGGFMLHAWLPPRFRVAFFCLLSLAGLFFFLGWPNGAWVIGIGSGLIGACYLPISWALRVTLICIAALVLAMVRTELEQPFWAVLGSMFMFRLIIYLCELRRATAPPPAALTLAYFFPLPNVCFLFFPILDFKTFRETYRTDASWEAAQVGVGWIARGLAHLLAYRVVKYYVLPAPHELADPVHLAVFLAANYALYLHVSGTFHIITGIFHLFGFELPRTHHNYFLASSFTDIWRRINVPWTGFMTKVFFFPAFFTLRGLGTGVAVALATLWVFLATWLLHSYQVFWLTGGLPFSLYDGALWMGVSVLVTCNLSLELARAPRKTPSHEGLTVWGAAVLSARVVGMFVLISIFWACWNTPALLVQARALLAADRLPLTGLAWVLGALAAAVGVGVCAQLAYDRLTRLRLLPPRVSPTVSAMGLTGSLAAVVLAGTPEVAAFFGPRAAGVMASLRRESVTPVEAALVVQGYYEEVLDARVPISPWLAALEGQALPRGSTSYVEMTRPSDDLLERELIPGWSGDVNGARLTINALGMRDRLDRTRQKPANTCRVAMVGSSVVMGYGVADEATFCGLLEDRVNARPEGDMRRVEFLNFGTGKSFAIHRRVLIDRKVFPLEPDAIFYFAHQDEFLGTARHLALLVARGNELPYPSLKEVARTAGITRETPWGASEALLQPFARDIVLGIYRDLTEECRRRGILAVWVYVPMPGVTSQPIQADYFVRIAEEGGFEIVNLSAWADGRRSDEVKLSAADHHPSVLGHQLLAERLHVVLRQRPQLLPVDRRIRRSP